MHAAEWMERCRQHHKREKKRNTPFEKSRNGKMHEHSMSHVLFCELRRQKSVDLEKDDVVVV